HTHTHTYAHTHARTHTQTIIIICSPTVAHLSRKTYFRKRSEEHASELHSLPTRRSSDLTHTHTHTHTRTHARTHKPSSSSAPPLLLTSVEKPILEKDRKSTRLNYTLSLHDALPISHTHTHIRTHARTHAHTNHHHHLHPHCCSPQ